MDVLLWVLAVALIVVGVVGIVVPALPGIGLVYAGIFLAAWIDQFQKIGSGTLITLGVLALAGFVIDYLATTLAAQKAGASKLGLLGAAIGTVAGIFMGLIGIFFMPLVGAAVGEYVARRDALHAGRVGLATWLGLLAGIVAKLGIVFVMIGVFVLKLVL